MLAHRRILIVAYLVLLHGLVYFALTHGVFSAKAAAECSEVAACVMFTVAARIAPDLISSSRHILILKTTSRST